MGGVGGAEDIHVIRDLPNIFNVNCDLHIFSTWNVIGGTSVKRDVSFIIYVICD